MDNYFVFFTAQTAFQFVAWDPKNATFRLHNNTSARAPVPLRARARQPNLARCGKHSEARMRWPEAPRRPDSL